MRNMMRNLRCCLVLGAAMAATFPTRASDVATNRVEVAGVRVIRSYYDIAAAPMVIKTFKGDPVATLSAVGIQAAPIAEKPPAHGGRSIGPCTVVNQDLHGTVDAPFSGDAIMIQHEQGIRLKFFGPQSLVAMTLFGPTTDTDTGVDMKFYGSDGKLLATVNADTKHDKSLAFNSRGAVFRGLETFEPMIAAVELVPTRIADNVRISIVGVDYVCFRDKPAGDDAVMVKKLVGQLGAEDFQTREAASKILADGPPFWAGLIQSLAETRDPEVRQRVAQVIESLEKKRINLTPNGLED